MFIRARIGNFLQRGKKEPLPVYSQFSCVWCLMNATQVRSHLTLFVSGFAKGSQASWFLSFVILMRRERCHHELVHCFFFTNLKRFSIMREFSITASSLHLTSDSQMFYHNVSNFVRTFFQARESKRAVALLTHPHPKRTWGDNCTMYRLAWSNGNGTVRSRGFVALITV